MKKKVKQFIKIFPHLRNWTPMSLSWRFQFFDTYMFLTNEMDPQYKWKENINKLNPYYKQFGFNVSRLDASYYSRVSGIPADHYVSRSMAVHYIYPYLDRYDMVSAYMDKNVQKKLLGLPDDHILATEDVIYNSNGVFYEGNGKECSREKAIKILLSYGKDLILKPSVESYGGHGVIKIISPMSRVQVEELLDKYRYNFVFQKVVEQHPTLARFNPTSVNTIRIVTYRDFERKCKVLYSCIRFGGEGTVTDNVCSGGGYTGINIKTGKLLDRKRYSYFVMDALPLPEKIPNEIPCWEAIKSASLELHSRIPQMDILGWDFSLSPDGHPILIEFNPRPGVGLQQAVGPMFSRKDMDELMEHVSKVNANYHKLGVMSFNDYPDRKTVHLKFGGMLRK